MDEECLPVAAQRAASDCRSAVKIRMSAQLPRKLMLKRPGDIRQVLQTGTKRSGRHINLYACAKAPARFAVLIPKRIGNAVKRNKMKRLARELYRKNREWFPQTTVIFFMKRYCSCYQTLEREIAHLANLK